jgi:hypothetical protein
MLDNLRSKGDVRFWKNTLLVVSFFVITPAVIAISLYSIFTLNKTATFDQISNYNDNPNLYLTQRSGIRVYAALPKDSKSISGSPDVSDARVEILRSYLKKYYSPLEPYAETLVVEADNNSLDYRLLTAIAQQESNLCKKMPSETYNCWGWGIHSKGTLGFESYEEGIKTVSAGIKENYIDYGYLTIEDIMSKYTPLSNGSWANGVNEFMTEMEDFD